MTEGERRAALEVLAEVIYELSAVEPAGRENALLRMFLCVRDGRPIRMFRQPPSAAELAAAVVKYHPEKVSP